jgi:hypothetical protein
MDDMVNVGNDAVGIQHAKGASKENGGYVTDDT